MNTEPLVPARRADLDALRGVAMLLGIVLHTALSFVWPAIWIVADSRQSPWYGVVISAIHGFRMPLFFVMSGYFSAMLLHRRGRRALVRHRFARVFLPLCLGMVTIIPATKWISAVAMSSASSSAARESVLAAADRPGGPANLWDAASLGDLAAMERFILEGAELDARDETLGATPMHWAALSGQAEAIELLARHGLEVDVLANDQSSPLHGASFLGHEEAVRALVRLGADVNATNPRGETPLGLATVDAGTTISYATMLQLPVIEEDLADRKAAVADLLRESGAVASSGLETATNLLMQIPLFDHLWFLWFLWWLVIGLAVVSAVGSRLPVPRFPRGLILSPARYLWVIPLTMVAQWFMVGGGGSAPTFGPDTSAGLLPMPHVFAYYAIFFGFGVLYFGADDGSAPVGGRGWLPLSIGLLVIFPMGIALMSGWSGPPGLPPGSIGQRLFSVFLQASYPWFLTIGLMGVFRQVFATENRTVRYLSDSAYWLYIAHMPLIIGAQYLVRDWPVPSILKFLLIVTVSTVFLLGTYQLLVRNTWLGRFLNGPRSRPVPPPNPEGATSTSTAG